MTNIVLIPLEVESVLKTLTVGKASGPNGLSNRVLKELSVQLSVPFCSLFNQSLQTGFLPSFYKEANVCPVPKKGDLSVVSNHRLISLLNAEAKVFERLVFKYLFNHIRDKNLLSSLQSGHLYGKQLFTWLSLVVSLMASFVLSFFPLDVLDEIWDLIESVSEGFHTYSFIPGDSTVNQLTFLYNTFCQALE